ncbi:Globin-coupled histidine kinase [Phycisphaerae bacterium RAS1]|nr:Globin-coupled histidine kinase [Phycisphaerae bacterium RAS1]
MPHPRSKLSQLRAPAVSATARESYNRAVSPAVLTELMDFVGFGPADAQNLRQLGPMVTPFFGAIVDRFYQEIARHPGAAGVIQDADQLSRLHEKLHEWLRTLFCGNYDAEYARRRSEIGRVHVRVGLAQHYMFAGMEVVWQELESRARTAAIPDVDSKLRSLHKLLTIETGIMLENYKGTYTEQVRQTERDAVQEQLTRAEHLAQIGQLAASLAHEIKNPLAGISGAIQVIREGIAPDDPRRPILAEVLRQIDRLDGTVKDLLEYARPRPPRFKSCDLQRVIDRVLTVLRAEPELRRVSVRFENSSAPPIMADESQIEQLVMNLVLNAVQASADGRTVMIATSAQPRTVELAVIDQGHGMDPVVARRAAEPFFTTKAKGTGLGLPICEKIVEMHGGTLGIDTAVGEGTTVTVRLPREQA